MATRSAEAAARESDLYLVPVVGALVLWARIVMLYAIDAGSQPKLRVDVTTLSSEAVDLLLDERNSALEALAGRGMLERGDMGALATRPLSAGHRVTLGRRG